MSSSNVGEKHYTSWSKLFENGAIVMLNNYAEIVEQLGEYDDEPRLASMCDDDCDDPCVCDHEIYQWYVVDGDTAEYVKYITGGRVKAYWSDCFGAYVLPVGHWGTGWDCVYVELNPELDPETVERLEVKK